MGESDDGEQDRRARFAREIREAEEQSFEHYRRDELSWFVDAIETLAGYQIEEVSRARQPLDPPRNQQPLWRRADIARLHPGR
jgi:hypothetical protein